MKEAKDATLTKIQKNQILELITQHGPPPVEFCWTETVQDEYGHITVRPNPYRVSVLTHRSTGYFCIFGAHSITASPGNVAKVEDFRHDDNWVKKEIACRRWLADVKREVDAPDLWATIGQEKVLSTAASALTLNNSRFNTAEQNLIVGKLEDIKGYLLEGQQFAADQAETIEREFAYLRESSERLGRKDWLNAVLGGLFGLAVTLALEPEKAKGLITLAGTALQSLWAVAQGYLS
jgi:hypothetical protein